MHNGGATWLPSIVSQSVRSAVVPAVEPSTPRQSVYEIITGQILAELEKGVVPWRKPWRTLPPANLVSKKPYRGINTFLLALAGYGSQYWLTYRQAQALGGNVRRGEHGTKIVFWKFNEYETETADGETENRTSAFLRYYTVFNLEQTEGLKALLALPPARPIESAEAIVTGMPNPPAYEQGFLACYTPSNDTVTMPSPTAFHSQAEYYSTMFHELTHSTGHAKRLAREGFDRPQNLAVNRTRVRSSWRRWVARCSAASQESNKPRSPIPPHTSSRWIARLKSDSRLVISAASAAQKAADYIRGESAKDSPAVSETGELRTWTTSGQPPMSARVAIYARVSTLNHGQDVSLQTRELQQFAAARSWTIAGEYIDVGVSGSKDSRPELNRLMADAHKRRFDVVCVWRFDRFARSVSHLLRALETFKALGIDFVSYSEQMDTSTPAGKMVFTVLGAVAELERSLIVERVRAGLRNARAKGKRLGRPRVSVDVSKVSRLHTTGPVHPGDC